MPEATAHNDALNLVDQTLSHFGSSAQQYLLRPMHDGDAPRAAPSEPTEAKELRDERIDDLKRDAARDEFNRRPELSDEQQEVFDAVIEYVRSGGRDDLPNVFYVDGPGGAGKTFLYTTIQLAMRGENRIVLTVAMSGIAALLLDGGRTAHSRFKLPVPLPLEGAVAGISARSGMAELLRHTDLLIWDEAPNAPKPAFDAVDR